MEKCLFCNFIGIVENHLRFCSKKEALIILTIGLHG